MKTGILLVNLGTPDSPAPDDVHRYLVEFLLDKRVIDSPWLLRQFLVRYLIVPSRYKQSASAYQAIWTKEGSPLLVHGKNLKDALQQKLGDGFHVELGMRYQNPPIAEAIEKLLKLNIDHLIILPLFPQYSSATTGSIHEKVMEILKTQMAIPKLTFIDHFFDHPVFIKALKEVSAPYSWKEYDQVLFSFHGLPERYLKNADRNNWCLKSSSCCQKICRSNRACYSAQCSATAQAVADSLGIPSDRHRICFQSRLGKEPWLQPYASDVIHSLAKEGKKRVLVFSPSFVCDCLETTYEIGVEYDQEFKKLGGEKLDLVPGLNTNSIWVEALKSIVLGSHALDNL